MTFNMESNEELIYSIKDLRSLTGLCEKTIRRHIHKEWSIGNKGPDGKTFLYGKSLLDELREMHNPSAQGETILRIEQQLKDLQDRFEAFEAKTSKVIRVLLKKNLAFQQQIKDLQNPS